MSTCKDCIHAEVCPDRNNVVRPCYFFKDRSKIIELSYSVKPGDKVYFILDGLGELDLKEYAFTVGDCAVCNTPDTIIDVSTKGFFYNGLHYRNEGELRPDDCDFVPWVELGKTAFLTREKAEQALKEKSDD